MLDRWLDPVPAGVTGELYVAGPGLARGYHGRPGLTGGAVRGVPVRGRGSGCTGPGTWPGGPADGELVYLGRADDQVKIRGFRVEPGEIEAVLAAHRRSPQAVVIGARGHPRRQAPDRRTWCRPPGREDGPGGMGGLGAAVRGYAAGRLPEFMVPSAVVVLDALPVTANGKVDRAALPAPEAAGGAVAGARRRCGGDHLRGVRAGAGRGPGGPGG